jgi:hypothetical protein
MAAEVTNTPNPGVSNNPCRMCHLKCPQGEEKSSQKYIQDFFGHPKLPHHRSWQSSIKNTKELWLSSQIDTRKEFEKKAQEFGLKDNISWKLMELKRDHFEDRTRIIKLEKEDPDRLYNPFIHLKSFDGSQDAPVESLHVYLLGVVKYLWETL